VVHNLERMIHRCSTKDEGHSVLQVVFIVAVGVAILLLLYGYIVRESAVGLFYFSLLFGGVVGIIAVPLALYARQNIAANAEFICRVTDAEFQCVCPVAGCGDSFAIKVAEITSLEREESAESYRWYVHDRSGARHWITTNYDNPVEDFVEALMALNPNIVEVRTREGNKSRIT